MQLFRDATLCNARLVSPVVALGEFDGAHIGHQGVLKYTVDRALRADRTPVAFAVYRRPVGDDPENLQIETLRQRLQRIGATGIPTVVVQSFRRWSSPALLVKALRSLRAGRGGKLSVVLEHGASAAMLEVVVSACGEIGADLEVFRPTVVDGVEVSTAALRRAIHKGDLATARAMLGRDPEVSGRVRHGFQRGRSIGFPTANLRLNAIVMPPNGVYAVRVRVGARLHGGVANLGVNPTFGGEQRTLEPFIFDFDGDLYGRRIDVQFVQGLRSERRFPSVDELVGQIRMDVEAARAALDRK